jgi:superfamily II DNA or RNA helicase
VTAAHIKLALRPYQDEGLNGIRAQLRAKKKAVLFVLPTGGGKTVTYAAMSQGAALKGNRILILEHRKELIRQASLALGGLGVRHQVIAPADKIADIRRAHVAKLGWPMIEDAAHVAVASVQTLGRRMPWLEEYDPQIIVIDEAHHAVAGTWKRIIEACPKAILIGVTATPCRADGVGLIDVFDALVLGPSMRELIQMGYLLPARVYSVPLSEDLSNVAHKGGDIDPAAAAAILDKPSITGNAVDHYRQLAPGRPAIAFCSSVKHAENVAAEFRAAGFRFEVVTGDMDDNDRDRRIMGLADGSLHGICTVDVVSEGTDIPVAEVAILLRPTESESLFLQQVGRVLRPVFADGFDLLIEESRHEAIAASGKPWGLVLDHVGNVLRHGMPHADRNWTLEGRKRGSGKKKEDEEQSEKVLQCPKCYFTSDPRTVCGGLKPDGTICTHVFEVQSRKVQEREGQLQEIVDDTIAPRIQTGKARDMAGLKAMGISDGRAQHILEARAEKERLQNELRELLSQWSRTTGRGVRDGWGFAMADVRDMKPKALKENIEKVGQALFMGEADNDNEPNEGVMYGNA